MMPPVGITHVAYYLPAQIHDVEDWVRLAATDTGSAAQLARAGVRQYRQASGESTLSMAASAVTTLLDEAAVDPATIDCLVHAHALQASAAPPPLSLPALLCRQCGLTRAETFSFSQQHCASLLAALRVIRAMFAARPALGRVVLVGADAMRHEPARSVNRAGLLSDGACAALIERAATKNRLLSLATQARGDGWRGAPGRTRPQVAARNLLDARALIRQVCAEAGLAPRDIGRVLPHHLDLPGWQRLLAALDIAPEKLFADNFARTAHVSVSDALINLRDCHTLRSGEPVLLYAGGIGGFSVAALLRH